MSFSNSISKAVLAISLAVSVAGYAQTSPEAGAKSKPAVDKLGLLTAIDCPNFDQMVSAYH